MQFIPVTRRSISRSLHHYICLRLQFRGGFLHFKSAPSLFREAASAAPPPTH